ncbi:hypothetical protein EAH79_16155 [Sphingomonas koreensis]|nr:hypothetical protein EAH79_16155 [Sphingomonas koreensis]
MDSLSVPARAAAAAVTLIGWAGLAVQFDASLAIDGAVGHTLWVMLRYFTIVANLLLAIVMTGVALGRTGAARPIWLGGVTIAILLVGVVYALLLRGMIELSGGAKLADLLLHTVTPILAPLWWLTLAPKGGLRWRDPLIWAVLPLAYFSYALARGGIEGLYAYPFMDVARLGWGQTLLNAAAMAIGFFVAGAALVWIDQRLARTMRRQR